MRKLVDEFLAETRAELFESLEACVEFYSREENFERLSRGEAGDNLMYKYRAIASFFSWPEVCAAALEATRGLAQLGANWWIARAWGTSLAVKLKHAYGTR
jgi:hypothetical protein